MTLSDYLHHYIWHDITTIEQEPTVVWIYVGARKGVPIVFGLMTAGRLSTDTFVKKTGYINAFITKEYLNARVLEHGVATPEEGKRISFVVIETPADAGKHVSQIKSRWH